MFFFFKNTNMSLSNLLSIRPKHHLLVSQPFALGEIKFFDILAVSSENPVKQVTAAIVTFSPNIMRKNKTSEIKRLGIVFGAFRLLLE